LKISQEAAMHHNSCFTGGLTTNSPAPVVVNGQNTVTNPITGNQQFFRLGQ
jgi:hypothetical protein